MDIQVLPIECKFGPVRAYAYYIDAPEPILIDTGVAASVPQLEEVLNINGYSIKNIRWILLTHGHVDHLGGVRDIVEKTNFQAKVVIPKTDAPLLKNRETHVEHYMKLQAQFVPLAIQEEHIENMLNNIGDGLEPFLEVSHGDTLTLNKGITMSVVGTPGHSLGSITYVINEHGWAFAGDAVQVFGGELSGIPAIENPTLYRQSLHHLINQVKPTRLYLGHPFRNAKGTILSPILLEEVEAALFESLLMDTKLSAIMDKHLFMKKQDKVDSESPYGTLDSVAKELNYTGDPYKMPCAFFVTMSGYRQEALQKNKR